jgi:hypothetical protein
MKLDAEGFKLQKDIEPAKEVKTQKAFNHELAGQVMAGNAERAESTAQTLKFLELHYRSGNSSTAVVMSI